MRLATDAFFPTRAATLNVTQLATAPFVISYQTAWEDGVAREAAGCRP